jgi:hypothetical protein
VHPERPLTAEWDQPPVVSCTSRTSQSYCVMVYSIISLHV